MTPDFTKLNQLRQRRIGWNPSKQRSDGRLAVDKEIGVEVERLAKAFCEDHGFIAYKIERWGCESLAHPAGFYLREDPDDGDLVQDHLVAFDLLISATTSLMLEVKLKSISGHGEWRHYLLDRKRLNWMRKSLNRSSDLQHLFVILDTNRTDAPAYGFFASPVSQLLANAPTYRPQIGPGEPAYQIPIGEFRPLSHFLEQHNPTKDYTHVVPPEPLPCIDEAA